MPLKFREDDADLYVLALAAHEDLKRLADVLTLDGSDGSKRRAQELLDDRGYRKALTENDLTLVWRSIAAELQTWGGDSVANTVRRLFKDHGGVSYREIVGDLCEHLKLKVKPATDIKSLEDQLLIALAQKSQQVSAEQMKRILEETARGVGLGDCMDGELSFDDLAKRSASDPKLAYVLAAAVPVIASTVLPFLARLSATTVLTLVAPRIGTSLVPGVGVAVMAASALSFLSSPAYRVTLPAVLEVIRIRRFVVLQEQLKEEVAA